MKSQIQRMDLILLVIQIMFAHVMTLKMVNGRSLESNCSDVEYKIESGAQFNVLLYKQYLRLQKKPKPHKTGIQLSAYNGTSIPVKGHCILHVVHKPKTVPVIFIVANINATPVPVLT